MIANAAIINIVLFGWLWPFGEARVDDTEVAIIQSLENRVIELPEVLRTEADDRAALAQYRLYLQLPDGDPGMRMEAMRRLGDLSLTVGEDENMVDPDYINGMRFHGDAIRLYEELLTKYDNYEKGIAWYVNIGIVFLVIAFAFAYYFQSYLAAFVVVLG